MLDSLYSGTPRYELPKIRVFHVAVQLLQDFAPGTRKYLVMIHFYTRIWKSGPETRSLSLIFYPIGYWLNSYLGLPLLFNKGNYQNSLCFSTGPHYVSCSLHADDNNIIILLDHLGRSGWPSHSPHSDHQRSCFGSTVHSTPRLFLILSESDVMIWCCGGAGWELRLTLKTLYLSEIN